MLQSVVMFESFWYQNPLLNIRFWHTIPPRRSKLRIVCLPVQNCTVPNLLQGNLLIQWCERCLMLIEFWSSLFSIMFFVDVNDGSDECQFHLVLEVEVHCCVALSLDSSVVPIWWLSICMQILTVICKRKTSRFSSLWIDRINFFNNYSACERTKSDERRLFWSKVC